jgi:hypothetical protein
MLTMPLPACARELTASSVGWPRNRSDAVALLMDLHANHSTEAPRRKPPVLIDLRRHDERSLYGSIPGAVHVPVDQWAEALDKVLPSVPPAHPPGISRIALTRPSTRDQ